MGSQGVLSRDKKGNSTLDVEAVRSDFPVLQQKVHEKPLVYLDNAATTQKPHSVIDAISRYYSQDNSNVHRGVHELSQRATELYEGARVKLQKFVNASSSSEIVFVRGATEAINLVAQSLDWKSHPGSEIVVSEMEHHSNIVPWQILCQQTDASLKVIPIDDRGNLDLQAYEKLVSDRTRLVSIGHVSNALGTINPVAEMVDIAHRKGALVLVDGAQAVQHMAVDVQELDCDFYAFSGHKMYAPTGIGALYGKKRLLEELPPWQGGGDMILSVSFSGTVFNELPYKFEAGTPNIAGAVGLGAAVDYLTELGLERIAEYEHGLLDYASREAARIPGLRIVGEADRKTSVLSFLLEGIHPHDIGTILDQEGVAIRTGHHCAQPVMERFGIPATARISLGLYNTRSEIDTAMAAIRKVQEVFS